VYNSFFSLRENPFNLTPDPRFLYLSTSHKEALDSLLLGINERKGLITITGNIGTGKTTLCRALLGRLDNSVKTALIFNSFISSIELMESLNYEFGVDIDDEPDTMETQTLLLKRFLLQNVSQGRNAVLMIDEAQNLSHNVLHQIRNLSEFQVGEEKLLQIVLMGQSELKENLANPALESFHESITLRYDLNPLEPKDIQGYIEHRLEVAGGKTNVVFADGVFKKIYASTWGNPRRINAICDRALLIAYVEGEYTVTIKMIEKALKELRGDIPVSPAKDWSMPRFNSAFLFVLLPLVVAIFSGWTLRNQVLHLFSEEPKPVAVKIVKPLNPLPKQIQRPISRVLASDEQKKSYKREVASGPSEPKPVPGYFTSGAEGSLSPSPDRPTFSVQVGAFQVEANAKNLLVELAQKGYNPIIVSISDYRNNLWHSVRIQENAASEDAYQVASNYRDREGKPAIVTKTGSLDPVSP
jgi:general secretion pathway protein A